jgi:hypothetical protein
MRSLFDRIGFGRAPKFGNDRDGLALRQLARLGADLSRPRHVVHFLYFGTEADARAAAEAIAGTWSTEVEPPTEDIAQWCVKADGNRTLGPDTVAAFRSWFERVAAEHGGEYDGWEGAVRP